MGPFLSRSTDDRENDAEGVVCAKEVWYDLKGSLMHKGNSAHHGHYVAQVYDNA